MRPGARSKKAKKTLSAAALALALISACATSPTGRKQLIVVPEAQMDAMGSQAFTQLKQTTPTVSDPELNRYVQCVANPLLRAAGGEAGEQKWEIAVFNDPSPNAFALPGGKIGVHAGLFKVARNQSQLATVIGHEIGHVNARHGSERMSQGLVAQGGLSLVSAFLSGRIQDPNQTKLIMGLLGLGTQVGVLLPFSRTQESEADMIGLRMMAQAGFDPRESVNLWRNMMAAAGGQSPPEFLSTHPASESRIEELESNMPEARQLAEAARRAGASPNCDEIRAEARSLG